tara:strand:+ start:147 stop:1328 length:1182 start_codon:yes stop_codon:yes gene_type:complete
MTIPFTCSFFKHFDKLDNLELNNYLKVNVIQPELFLDTDHTNHKQILAIFNNQVNRPRVPFKQKNVEYTALYTNFNNIDFNKTPALIPARDSIELLEFTFSNMLKYKVFDHILPVLIDDRSIRQEEMEKLADKYNALYIRMDYESPTFNFSVINNAAAAFCHKIGFNDIILWNSDLWVDNKKTIPYLLERHKKNKENDVYATGVKLLYPTKGFCDLIDDDKFITSLAKDFGVDHKRIEQLAPHGSVQFGGSSYTMIPYFNGGTPIIASPIHFGRFSQSGLPELSIDKQVDFMTGAFILCDLEIFKKVGALNPSLNSQFQDVDFCLRLSHAPYKIMFYAKGVHMLHAESMSLSSKGSSREEKGMKSTEEFNRDLFSNQTMYAALWNDLTVLGGR